jgi:protein-L-isoaspartate(D-aspartate) O-methyltransferase
MSGPDAETKMAFLFSLRARGVTDARVLDAFEKTDRAGFIRGVFAQRAYEDTPLPISCGQTISQPSIVALMTQALQVQSRHKVLEVGTGSGYQAAILSRLARRVYTVDRHRELVRQAQALFDALDLHNITSLTADGGLGYPQQAPFDRIMVTAAAEDVPRALLDQLQLGGVLVCPVGPSEGVQTLIRVLKTDAGYDYDEICDVRFVPLLAGIAQGDDR